MDITRALSFPFDDEDWIVKFAVGSLMSLVGVFLPFILLGYQVNVARNVIRGKKRPLPGKPAKNPPPPTLLLTIWITYLAPATLST